MRKTAVSLLMVGLFVATAYPFKMGVEFSAGGDFQLGVNMRFTELFEFKPQLGFGFGEDYGEMALTLDGNFYLPDISPLQHYAGFTFNVHVGTDIDYNNVGLGGQYGLRYDINETISIFGEGGLLMWFDPFYMTTFKGGLGCTIYFPEF